MDNQYNPILDESSIIKTFQILMTSMIQFWMDIMLNNILWKMADQYNPILDVYYIQKILP